MSADKPKPPEVILSSRGIRALLGDSRPGDPSEGQTQQQITDYYRNAKEGDRAVIRQTYGRFLWFLVTTIAGTNPKRGRIYLKDAPRMGYGGVAFYTKSGKNCRAPTGQSSVVAPTPEVLEHAEKHPHQSFGVSFEIPFPTRPE